MCHVSQGARSKTAGPAPCPPPERTTPADRGPGTQSPGPRSPGAGSGMLCRLSELRALAVRRLRLWDPRPGPRWGPSSLGPRVAAEFLKPVTALQHSYTVNLCNFLLLCCMLFLAFF